MVNIDPTIKKGGRKVGPIKAIFYGAFNVEKGFRKDHSAKPKVSENCSLFRKEKFTLVQHALAIDVSVPFVNFLTVLQSEGPLVPIIYKAMKDLLKIVMKRFLKAKVIDGLSGKELQKVDVTKKENQLGDKLEIGAKTGRLLKNLSPIEQKKEREAMLKSYERSVAYLQKKLPLDNAILAKAACLHPDNRKK